MTPTHVPDDDCTVFEADSTEVTGVTASPVESAIRHAKGLSQVIQVTSPEGRVYEFLPYLAAPGWLWIESHPDAGDARIVEETRVRNLMNLYDPDVRVIDEFESSFGGPMEGSE